MKVKQVVILFLFVSIFKSGSTLLEKTKDDIANRGRLKVKSMLQSQLPEERSRVIECERDPKGQIYADMFSHARAAAKLKVGDEIIEADGLVAILFEKDYEVTNFAEIEEKIERKKQEIVQIVKKKNADGEILIGLGVGYICQDVVQNSTFKITPNKRKQDKKPIAHLSVVFTFTRRTQVSDGLPLDTAIWKETAKIQTAKFRFGDREFRKTAELWATVYSNCDAKDEPNITSTSKHVWVTCLTACDKSSATSFISGFFTTNAHLFNGEFRMSFAWIRSVDYKYTAGSSNLEIVARNGGLGCFVLVTSLPEGETFLLYPQAEKPATIVHLNDKWTGITKIPSGTVNIEVSKILHKLPCKHFTPEQQNALVNCIPGLPVKTYCPLAASIARESRYRHSPIGNSRNWDINPVKKSTTATFTAIFDFPVQTGIPVEITREHLGNIGEQISELSNILRGAAFGRLIERDVETNRTKSILILVLIIDDEFLGFKLNNIRLNAAAMARIDEHAKKRRPFTFFDNEPNSPLLENISTNKYYEVKDQSSLIQVQRNLENFIAHNPQGSVAVAIVSGSVEFGSAKHLKKTYCIIYCSTPTKDSDIYFTAPAMIIHPSKEPHKKPESAPINFKITTDPGPEDMFEISPISIIELDGVTTITQDFTPEEQDILVRRIPGISLQKHCPLAAKIAHHRSAAEAEVPIWKQISRSTKPVLESPPAKFTRIFDFPVETNHYYPMGPRKINLELIEKQISEIDKPIVGAAFGQLVQWHVETNSIKSVINLVLIIDEEFLEFKLGDIRVNPLAAARVVELAKEGKPFEFFDNEPNSPLCVSFSANENHELANPSNLLEVKQKLENFLKQYSEGSVAIVIVHEVSEATCIQLSYSITYCIIFCSTFTEYSATYYQPSLAAVDQKSEHGNLISDPSTGDTTLTENENSKHRPTPASNGAEM